MCAFVSPSSSSNISFKVSEFGSGNGFLHPSTPTPPSASDSVVTPAMSSDSDSRPCEESHLRDMI